MLFLNRYNKTEQGLYNYYYSLVIGSAVYNVGVSSEATGLITKLNLSDGEVIWEKSYRFKEPISFRKIIACSNNSDFLVLGTTSSTRSNICLLRIRADGTIIWKKFLNNANYYMPDDKNFNTLVDIGNENYILAFTEIISQNNYTTIIKFNQSGDETFQKRIQAKDNFKLKGVAVSPQDKIGLYGSMQDENTGYITATIIEFSFNLEIIKVIKAGNYASDFIHFFYYENKYMACCRNESHNIFFVRFHISGTDVITEESKLHDGPAFENIKHNKNFLYTETYDRLDAVISKLDYDFKPLWTKKINFVKDQLAFGILSDVTEKNIIINNGLQSGLPESNINAVIGALDLELESCRTVREPIIKLIDKDCLFSVVKVEFYPIDNYRFANISNPSITVPVSVVEDICPEDTFELDEDCSAVQSKHLYLQSAGSLGQDSTRGIHLRWALKEGLSQHLPKADYAATTHNFNKKDDYVRIYRAKYIPVKVVLDFNIPPLQINEIGNQKNWVYNVNGKVFYVHFRNAIQYNQVRGTINPATDPLIFIKNYGSSLIEVENKTELSFKITANFDVFGGNDYIKTELLSVPENKITAPRAASLRKKYRTAELNTSPLIAENIRGVRFIGYNTCVLSLSFEFYSDFIETTQALGGWKYIDKYALTKETNTAYKRLEPRPGCLNNWLRYNDQSFVNIENYHTRWNSSSLDELERIAVCVDKYITLSNNANNPLAVESFPFVDAGAVETCNLTYPDYDPEDPDNAEYNPYIPKGHEVTGIDISFLEVLQLGSLDFHIARMLGLGTLDLQPQAAQEQYIYMAEYFTFSNLQDWQGTTEVQHLYCSLPTSLSDQRLPLPIDLKEPVPGMFFNTGYDNSKTDQQEYNQINDPANNGFQAVELTEDGYTPDGKARYYTFYHQEIPEEQYNAPFYYIDDEFIACESTDPVFAGIEYRKTGDPKWIKPELSFNPDYFNIDPTVPAQQRNQTVEIVIPDRGGALYIHAVKQSISQDYSSYGINWFSRASSSNVIHTVETILAPKNTLLPPANVTATLIQKENPLLLSTSYEQTLYENNPASDKTLVRLTFEYNHAQELIDYHHKINGEIVPNYFETENNKEMFADQIQLFFRDSVPNSIQGRIKEIVPLGNPLLIEVHTEPFPVYSSGINENIVPQTIPPTYNEAYIPSVPLGVEDNFIGSVMFVDGVEYIVHQVDNTGAYPKFTILKADASGALLDINTIPDPNTEILQPQTGSFFMIVENMQNLSSWGLPDSQSFNVNIDHIQVHREDEIIIKNIDCNTETHIQKFRGIYREAEIKKIFEKIYLDENADDFDPQTSPFVEKHLGLYKVTFPDFQLTQHSQYNLPNGNSVEWHNGIVRIHTLSDLGKTPRKEFKVFRTQNIGSPSDDLILYIQDLTFPTSDLDSLSNYQGKIMSEEDSVTSVNLSVNYYPGYKVYLYKDNNLILNKDTVLPQGNDQVRYTIFGLRSRDFANEFEFDNNVDFFSRMSVPALMFANAVIEPMQPQKPTGGMYATRPDYFGKSSYTFRTKYGSEQKIHKPYSVQFSRASDIQLLSAIYDNSVNYGEDGQFIPNTVQQVIRDIFQNGEEDFYVDRWNDLLSFEYPGGVFASFDQRTLPMPDNPVFIVSINDFIDKHNEGFGTTIPHLPEDFNLNTIVIPAGPQNSVLIVRDFLKDIMLNCFVSLTEIPVVYDYVNGNDYTPIPKKQVIRDRNGYLLKPTDQEFDMAPMMRRIDPPGAQYESQFTDFGLDGASNAKYFYAVREINNQLKMSDYSEILGPISLVNTAPPVAPEIIKVVPVLENRILGIVPSVQLQINAYPRVQNIAKISIYRTDNPADALSIRTMNLVKVLDLEAENLLDDAQWIFEDDFSDLTEVPFGDPLFYRLTVSRTIRYNDKELNNIVDYAPSEASKLIITNVVENYNPVSPTLDYYSYPLNQNNELTNVILHWKKTSYKGKYHIYKMTSQGNWKQIFELQTNDQDIYLPLNLTQLDSSDLSVVDSEGNAIYHHFKVITENTAGMISTQENILTIPNQTNWQDVEDIGDI